jgi:taurine transport system substrate-binding protein
MNSNAKHTPIRRTLKQLALGLGLTALASHAAMAETLTIGYQGMMNPWKAAIADKALEAATGLDIQWCQGDYRDGLRRCGYRDRRFQPDRRCHQPRR